MGGEADPRLAQARRNLQDRDWEGARSRFEAAAAGGPRGDVLAGWGTALWWLGDRRGSLARLAEAYDAHLADDQPDSAVLVASQLVPYYGAALGNLPAAHGWTERASHLVDRYDLEPVRGWALLCQSAMSGAGGDPEQALRLAASAHDAAERSGDPELELRTTGERGGHLMVLGKVREGTALLDAASAGALAPSVSHDTAVYVLCKTIDACSLTADLGRAASWLRLADGYVAQHPAVHLYGLCRTNHARVLFAMGRWTQAEAELDRAIAATDVAEPVVQAMARCALASIRTARGDLDGAEEQLAGLDALPFAALPLAELRLSHGRADEAVTVATRRLRHAHGRHAESAALLSLLVDAHLALGQPDKAAEHVTVLSDLARAAESPLVQAQAARAEGNVLALQQDPRALTQLEAALAILAELGLPYEVARTRLALGRAMAAADPAGSSREVRDALAGFRSLGAARAVDEALAALRALGAPSAPNSGPRAARPAHPQGARGPGPARRRPDQPADRAETVRQPQDGREPREPSAGQARPETPRRGDGVRAPHARAGPRRRTAGVRIGETPHDPRRVHPAR